MPSAVQEVFSVDFPTLSLNLFSNALDDRLDIVDLHWHDRLEIIHVIDGQGLITVDFNELPVKKGDLIIVPPRALHMARGRNGRLLVSETAVFSLDCFRPNCTFRNLIRPKMAGYGEMLQLMEKIFAPRQGTLANQELLLRGYVTALYALLCCYGYAGSTDTDINDSSMAIKTVLAYIHEHYREKLQVDTLAKLSGYSKFYFVRYFASRVGCSCSYYIRAIRLSHAKELLRGTDLSISEVGEESGFESLSYFVKVFRENTGTTPTKFRNAMRSDARSTDCRCMIP